MLPGNKTRGHVLNDAWPQCSANTQTASGTKTKLPMPTTTTTKNQPPFRVMVLLFCIRFKSSCTLKIMNIFCLTDGGEKLFS